MLKISFRSLVMAAFWFALLPIVVFGQDTEELCRLFVNRAFREIGDNCANLGEAEACYAYGERGEVASTFYIDGQPRVILENFFDNPSERTVILDEEQRETLESMKTDEFILDTDGDDEAEDQWGVSFQMVRGNLPRQLELDEAVYILFGGSRIENGIYPEDALVLPENPLMVTAAENTILYGSPVGLGYLVPADEVGTVSGTLEADGISPDGEWLRVFYLYQRRFGQRATAWVRVADLTGARGIETLPVIGPETYTAMQRLFLSNIFEDPICENVPPPGVLIQGPASIEFDFWINNLPSRVTSTSYFEQIAPRRMRITTLSGYTVLWPDSGSEVVIPAGFHRVVCLTPLLNLGIDDLQNDRELDNDCGEAGIGALNGDDLDAMEGVTLLPDSLLNYSLSTIPEIVCPSGTGDPACTLRIPLRQQLQVQVLCEDGTVGEGTCREFGLFVDTGGHSNTGVFVENPAGGSETDTSVVTLNPPQPPVLVTGPDDTSPDDTPTDDTDNRPIGNPGNDRDVGRAGEDPSGRNRNP